MMKRLQAYKFRLDPTFAQHILLKRFAGCARVVWNKGLALQQALREKEEKRLGYAGLCKVLTTWRNDPETPWLAEASVDIQQQMLRDLETAYKRFFEKVADFPRFKKKPTGIAFGSPSQNPSSSIRKTKRSSCPSLAGLVIEEARRRRAWFETSRSAAKRANGTFRFKPSESWPSPHPPALPPLASMSALSGSPHCGTVSLRGLRPHGER